TCTVANPNKETIGPFVSDLASLHQAVVPSEPENSTPRASSQQSFKSADSDSEFKADDLLPSSLTDPPKPPKIKQVNMSTFDASNIKLVTDKLDRDNFSAWRWAMITTLGYKGLDDYILLDQTEEMKKKEDYQQHCKMATNFIRMHLTTDNLERFVPDVTDYNAKKLWDSIESHFMAKTMENAASAMDKYFDIHFDKSNMDKSISEIRHSYRHLCEVGAKKFGKEGLTAMAVVFALRKLPPDYDTFRTLQFKEFKDSEPIEMETFLRSLEVEVRRKRESLQEAVAASTALAVSQFQQGADPKKKGRKVQCTGGKHHPDATHAKSECFHLHKDKAIAHHQAAIERLTKSLPKASLGAKSDFKDVIVLDSGASGHYLKDCSYFLSLSSTSSSVFGANGAAIPILGFGPAVIQTAIGPLSLNMAYYAPKLSNSLISLTHYI
ncbi:hypothetical protein PTTG_30406, partial [Puccinia triticina 1-1 BBBD Race 1]|uniref:Retrovirus-related Pol polyprotein from transposon TNT 1-94-like beta-barrel domain-containing protein n=2 Tax=Puccinia triticina (isolate 1-1 / race 1 (BBBD)) TaxID=630390 RepID=A0ABL7D5U8_PUCT1